MDTLRQDLKYAARRFQRDPAFTAIAVLTLAIGIGANSAIFSVINGVLLKPLPYPASDRLIAGHQVTNKGRLAVMSPLNFLDWKAQSRSVADAAAYSVGSYTLTGAGEATRLDATDVSASFFDVLGVGPILGRGFRADENEPGRNHVAVLSHTLWRSRFGGDTGIVGRTIQLDRAPYTVVGVMPEGFSFPPKQELWTPLEYDNVFLQKSRGAWYLDAVGRLRDGATADQARTEAELIGQRLAAAYQVNALVGLTVVPLREDIVGDTRPALLVLAGAVGFVLLIACMNVANLLLARAAVRQTEIAVRAALGGSRTRLVRQLVTESVLVGIVGGAAGLLVASWATDALVALQPQGVPRLSEVHIDRVVLLFTLLVSIATGLVFGMLPAVQATRAELAPSLKEGGRGAARGTHRLRGSLVVAETALALTLLAGAGLLARSFVRLEQVDPGFRPRDVLTLRVALPGTSEERPETAAFHARLLERFRALPGVQTAGATMGLPLGGSSFNLSFEIKGRPPVEPGHEPELETRVVTPGYFEAMGIPLRRGRFFTAADRRDAPWVTIITESAARRYFPDENPIGRTIELGWRSGEGQPRHGGEIVGVVGDVKELRLAGESAPQIYMPHAQAPVNRLDYVLRTSVPPKALAAAAERAVHEIDANVPVTRVLPLDAVLAQSISQPRFYMLLLGIFAAAALTLAAIGIFGVISYGVAQRTREIGIRMALGADRSEVLVMVLRQSMTLASAGIVIGVVVSLALSRSLESLLFRVSPTDPLTYAMVAALLLGIAFVASAVPGLRATRVNPAIALRWE